MSIKASDLLPTVQTALDEHWAYKSPAYYWGGPVDCAGLIWLAYKVANGNVACSWLLRGSNSMWRQNSIASTRQSVSNALASGALVAGMPVFKTRKWTESQSSNQWYGSSLDGGQDVHHVGMYIGDGLVIEAKGTKWGVVSSDVKDWHLTCRFKNTDYDAEAIEQPTSGADDPTADAPVITSITQDGFNLTITWTGTNISGAVYRVMYTDEGTWLTAASPQLFAVIDLTGWSLETEGGSHILPFKVFAFADGYELQSDTKSIDVTQLAETVSGTSRKIDDVEDDFSILPLLKASGVI